MFLRPQHFQQQERYLLHRLESRCSGLLPFSWGVDKLVLDKEMLDLGKLLINECRGVFPDGTPVNIPHDHPPPQPLEVANEIKNEEVFLALPLSVSSAKEVFREQTYDPLCRYRLQELDSKDVHSDIAESSAVIESGELATQLRLAGQDQGAFTVIPLCKIIERQTDSRVMLDPKFIPSCLQAGGSPVLSDYIREIYGLLQHRSAALAGRLGSPGAGGTGEIVDFLFLQIINRYVPLFKHFAELQALHPLPLYQTLIQLAGELATITRRERLPGEFPEYLHKQLTATFEPVVDAVREALNWVSDLRAVAIPLEEHKYGIRTAKIYDRQLIQSALFVLAVNADVPTESLRTSFPRQTTIATVEKLRDLVMTHTPGIKINALAVAPRQIPYHTGFTYFELDKHSELWHELEKTGAIAMHFSGDYPGLELEFWAIKG